MVDSAALPLINTLSISALFHPHALLMQLVLERHVFRLLGRGALHEDDFSPIVFPIFAEVIICHSSFISERYRSHAERASPEKYLTITKVECPRTELLDLLDVMTHKG